MPIVNTESLYFFKNFLIILAFFLLSCYNRIMKNERVILKMKLSKLLYILSALVLVLCLGGIALTIGRITQYGIHGLNDILRYPFLIVVQIFCIILVVALLIKAEYVITNTHVIARYGLIKDKIEIKNITSLLWDTDLKKMTVYMGEQFFVFAFSSADSHEFVQAVRKINPSIEYSFTNTENKE